MMTHDGRAFETPNDGRFRSKGSVHPWVAPIPNLTHVDVIIMREIGGKPTVAVGEPLALADRHRSAGIGATIPFQLLGQLQHPTSAAI
jgi:hypothetical protein